MQNIGLIILAAIVSLLIALFQYMYKVKNRSHKSLLFAFLRFLSVFLLLVLLINPTLKNTSYFVEKSTLVVAVDNSASIKHLKQGEAVISAINKLKNNEDLNDKFDVVYYSFSDRLIDSLALGFDQKQTNINNVLENLDQIYKNATAPTILITDGNQTYGRDYQFNTDRYKQQIFPVIVGDTIEVVDTKIEQLNVNRYAYLKNKFPVEVIVSYTGKESITSKLVIQSNKKTIFSEPISFSATQNSRIINFTIPANNVGVVKYSAYLLPLNNEKNTINNTKSFAVEIIDQKTNILLVSNLVHPDIGAIKKSVESNERRSLTINKPTKVNDLDDYQLVILYQPNSLFNTVYQELDKKKKNRFTITGSKTDWRFLNRVQGNYKQEITRETDYYLPRYNSNYGTFLLDDIGFNEYPPLIGTFGDLTMVAPNDVLLYRNINTIITDDPLLTTIENNGQREGVLFGEGIWRWRAQNYLDSKSFEDFDEFFSKILQYLASDKPKNRLNTIAESFYYGNSNIIIKAEYFTKNYEFDRRGNLVISLKNKDTGGVQTVPMLLKNNSYEVDLSSFPSGTYEYKVTVNGDNISRSGTFSILDYDVEQQLLNADVTKLKNIATNTKGASYFLDQNTLLINDLIKDERYQPVQKSKESIVSLIDWKYLLGIILFLLAIEWFVRKYNGLI